MVDSKYTNIGDHVTTLDWTNHIIPQVKYCTTRPRHGALGPDIHGLEQPNGLARLQFLGRKVGKILEEQSDNHDIMISWLYNSGSVNFIELLNSTIKILKQLTSEVSTK